MAIEVLCNDLLWAEKRRPNLAQKINEEVKLLTSIGEIMSIGTPIERVGPQTPNFFLGSQGGPNRWIIGLIISFEKLLLKNRK